MSRFCDDRNFLAVDEYAQTSPSANYKNQQEVRRQRTKIDYARTKKICFNHQKSFHRPTKKMI
jgi:hypothetical protein